MLPADLLLVTSREGRPGRASPRYLSGRDEVWVRAVIDAFDAYVGRTIGQREAELPQRVRSIARDHGVSARAADGVGYALSRRFKSEVDAKLDPANVRMVTFEEGARNEPVRMARFCAVIPIWKLGTKRCGHSVGPIPPALTVRVG